jgi:hypothetical protein
MTTPEDQAPPGGRTRSRVATPRAPRRAGRRPRPRSGGIRRPHRAGWRNRNSRRPGAMGRGRRRRVCPGRFRLGWGRRCHGRPDRLHRDLVRRSLLPADRAIIRRGGNPCCRGRRRNRPPGPGSLPTVGAPLCGPGNVSRPSSGLARTPRRAWRRSRGPCPRRAGDCLVAVSSVC